MGRTGTDKIEFSENTLRRLENIGLRPVEHLDNDEQIYFFDDFVIEQKEDEQNNEQYEK